MKKITELLKDFIKCIILGSIISLVVILVIGIISFLVSKFDWYKALEVVRSAMLIIGSLGMLLGAILILKKKDEKELENIEQWKEKYNVFSYKVVIIIISITITLYGGLIDWLIINFK